MLIRPGDELGSDALLEFGFRTLLEVLSTIVRNTSEARVGQRSGSSFQMTTMPNPTQQRAMQLLQSITM